MRACLALFVSSFATAPVWSQNLIVNGSFETGSPSLGPRPTTLGVWRGDRVLYVGDTLGINNFDGSRMLQFINGEFVPSSSIGSQYWQNVDMSAFASDIAIGNAALNASTYFNRVAGNSQTDTEFNLVIRARSGTPSSFVGLDEREFKLFADALPGTWQQATINSFVLPLGTTHVQLEINATENVFDNTSNPEFDGHFADAVFVNVVPVPEPGSILLLGAVGILCIYRRSKDKKTA